MDASDDACIPLLSDEKENHWSYFTDKRTRSSGDDREIHDDERYALPESSSQDVVCLFVVAFDTRAGNMVEWCTPSDCDLVGIEFKAMASGSHRIFKDFIYFKKDNLYGLSCFERMSVESELERGARMKSVGILSTSYTNLSGHIEFLEQQVRHLLETPASYEQLQEFYERRKATIPLSVDCFPSNSVVSEMPVRHSRSSLRAQVHPAGCFSQFVKFFGDKIFVLWKFALLKQRILFFSPPPIGIVCYRVYCAATLTHHNIPDMSRGIANPLFYVNIADIDSLETEMSYIACTTEKIFEAKPQLYDLYVDNQNLKSNQSTHKLSVSQSDRTNFYRLQSQIRALTMYRGGNNEDDEDIFVDFFTQLNSNLFRTLLDISYSQDKEVTPETVRSLGLDPSADHNFLLELIATYDIDVILADSSPCCQLKF